MDLLKHMEELVRRAGDIVLSATNIADCTHLKTSAADMVTSYDVQVEDFLKENLPKLLNSSVFYGEEEKENSDPRTGWAFIVDPIDGTVNFVRGLRQSAVSVALAKDGQVQYAVIFDPYRKEMFTAKRGAGAWLNGKPIHVSDRSLSEGIFGMGTTPYNRDMHEKTMHLTSQLFERSCDFRRMGAAALDLCNVACGRTEVFFEYQLCPWDFAAGSLLITEAGGYISTLENEPISLHQNCSVWASNQVNASVLNSLSV